MSRPPITPGQRFTRLVTLERLPGPGLTRWLCRCDCGQEKTARPDHLRHGTVKSCGCLQREVRATNGRASRRTHGLSSHPLRKVWVHMHARCEDPDAIGYAYYGGRGIAVCARWSDFRAFVEDMGPRPVGTTLDRIDNAKGYEPGNCRWATRVEQNNNKDNNHRLTIGGETLTISEWARRNGVKPAIAFKRIYAGWPPVLAVAPGPHHGRIDYVALGRSGGKASARQRRIRSELDRLLDGSAA